MTFFSTLRYCPHLLQVAPRVVVPSKGGVGGGDVKLLNSRSGLDYIFLVLVEVLERLLLFYADGAVVSLEEAATFM